MKEIIHEIVSNMGYDGLPLIRIKGNKFLIGTRAQYLLQIGSLIVV